MDRLPHIPEAAAGYVFALELACSIALDVRHDFVYLMSLLANDKRLGARTPCRIKHEAIALLQDI